MRRLAVAFALAGTALAIGCGNDTELKSMNFDRYAVCVQVEDVARDIQTAPKLQPLSKVFAR